jgi:twitching motility protein PilT
MINTAAIQERIRTGAQLEQLPELIAEGRQQYGMQSFDQSLLELMRSGTISYETAVYHSTTPADFKLKVSGVEGASDLSWTPGLGG